MDLFITSLTAAFCATLYFVQTLSVIFERRTKGIVHGDGEDKTTKKRIRGHANSAEQMPIFIILLGLLEFHGANGLGIMAACFMAGRLLHAAYFMNIGLHYLFRTIGMCLTLLAQCWAIFLLIVSLS